MGSLNMARDSVASCVFNSRLIAVGGYTANFKPLNVVDIYDETEDAWHHSEATNKAKDGLMFVTSSCFETKHSDRGSVISDK